MRTKTLLIAAAALAVGINTSEAQAFSQTIVGYVNISITNNGYYAAATPLDFDGTQTNNRITSVLSNSLPYNSIVEVWNGTSYILDTYNSKTKNWSNTNVFLNPGLGYFIYNPSNYVVNYTVAGTVLEGNLTNTIIDTTGMYSFLGLMVPIAGRISTDLGYQASPGDRVQLWNQTLNGGTGSFNLYTYNGKSKTWSPVEPFIDVGQGFFLATTNYHATLNTNWPWPGPVPLP